MALPPGNVLSILVLASPLANCAGTTTSVRGGAFHPEEGKRPTGNPTTFIRPARRTPIVGVDGASLQGCRGRLN
jgi:hypothetical protein